MSSALITVTGVKVSISVCGISEPVTVTLSSVVALLPVSWATAAVEPISSAPASARLRELGLKGEGIRSVMSAKSCKSSGGVVWVFLPNAGGCTSMGDTGFSNLTCS